MNLKLRFKNKTVLLALITAVVAFIYQLLGIFNVVPAVAEDTIMQLVALVLNVLVGLGILIDPTTKGVGDSLNALGYNKPNDGGDEEYGMGDPNAGDFDEAEDEEV